MSDGKMRYRAPDRSQLRLFYRVQASDLAAAVEVVPVRFRVREQKQRFVCVHCGAWTHACEGGADELPFGCADCWVRATEAIADARDALADDFDDQRDEVDVVASAASGPIDE